VRLVRLVMAVRLQTARGLRQTPAVLTPRSTQALPMQAV
jgi:hypothetical protein